MKPQTIRLWDVFVIGPALIYTATKYNQLPNELRIFLFATGLGTTLYNGYNYLKVQQSTTLPVNN